MSEARKMTADEEFEAWFHATRVKTCTSPTARMAYLAAAQAKLAELTAPGEYTRFCPVSFQHPPHDSCDGTPYIGYLERTIEQLQARVRQLESMNDDAANLLVHARNAAEQAEAKLAEYQEDAERYRVLHNGDLPNYAVMSCYEGDDRWSTIDGDNLDRAIDAARRREEA